MESKSVQDIANLKHLRWDSLWWDSHHSEIGCPWATWEFPAHIVCTPGSELGFQVQDLTHALGESNQLIPLFGLRVHIKLPIHLLYLGWIIGKTSCHPGSLFSSAGDSHDQAQRGTVGSSLISWLTCQLVSVLCKIYWLWPRAHASLLQASSSVVFLCTFAPIKF